MVPLSLLVKIAQQLVPDRAPGQYIHPLAEGLCLITEQSQHILHQNTVVGTCVLASAQQMRIVDKQNIAGAPGHHLQTVPHGTGKGQIPAEHAAGAHFLQHGSHPLLIDSNQGRAAALHDTNGVRRLPAKS